MLMWMSESLLHIICYHYKICIYQKNHYKICIYLKGVFLAMVQGKAYSHGTGFIMVHGMP